jgi:hypothetical protein
MRATVETRARGAVTLCFLASVAWPAHAGAQEGPPRPIAERAILLAVASEVRSTTDVAFRYDWGEGWPVDYKVRLVPDNFPVPDALEEMAQAIGDATVGPVQIECDQREQECTTEPDVAAVALFSNLRLITPTDGRTST